MSDFVSSSAQMKDHVQPQERMQSELLFEEFLRACGYTDWTHEELIEEKRRRPDYHLRHHGSSVFFEIKEFDAPTQIFTGAHNPYPAIREKINIATRQFKEYKEFSCSLVLANPKSVFVDIHDPFTVMGAMLGNLGFQFQLGPSSDQRRIERIFTHGGKMVDDKHQKPQNTTVSAVIVLGQYPLRRRRRQLATKDLQRKLGRQTTLGEDLTISDAFPDTSDLHPLRVVVYKNPFARIVFPDDLFRGPFDERWGIDEAGFLHRDRVGDEAAALEAALGDV